MLSTGLCTCISWTSLGFQPACFCSCWISLGLATHGCSRVSSRGIICMFHPQLGVTSSFAERVFSPSARFSWRLTSTSSRYDLWRTPLVNVCQLYFVLLVKTHRARWSKVNNTHCPPLVHQTGPLLKAVCQVGQVWCALGESGESVPSCLCFLCVSVGSWRICSIIFTRVEVRLTSRWLSRSSFSFLLVVLFCFFLVLMQHLGSPWPFRDDREWPCSKISLFLQHPQMPPIWCHGVAHILVS